MNNGVTIGLKFKLLRKEKNKSLEEVAKSVALTKMYLSEIERDLKVPSDHVLRRICDYYEVDEAEFFELIGRTPLLVREELNRSKNLQELLLQIAKDSKLDEGKKDEMYNEMYSMYKQFSKHIKEGIVKNKNIGKKSKE